MKTENKTASEILEQYLKFPVNVAVERDSTMYVKNVLLAMEEYGNQRFLEGRKEAEWIDVNERLPEIGRCIVNIDNGDILMASFDNENEFWNYQTIGNLTESVIRWMPSPKNTK